MRSSAAKPTLPRQPRKPAVQPASNPALKSTSSAARKSASSPGRKPSPATQAGPGQAADPQQPGNSSSLASPLSAGSCRIGTAGWTLPSQHADLFPASAAGEKPPQPKPSHLERYSPRFNCVEVNSSFHRPHRRTTWERWAASTPAEFRFAVKVPKAITHTAKLLNCGAPLQEFFDQVSGLGAKLGVLLVQLPPSLSFDEGVVHEFFTTLRELHPTSAGTASVALEPRHASWFTAPVDRLLRGFEVARVAADPPKGSPLAARPGGWNGLHYFRLHGAPRTYYSQYSPEFLTRFAATLRDERTAESSPWVIFDNTALGHATSDAFSLVSLLAQK